MWARRRAIVNWSLKVKVPFDFSFYHSSPSLKRCASRNASAMGFKQRIVARSVCKRQTYAMHDLDLDIFLRSLQMRFESLWEPCDDSEWWQLILNTIGRKKVQCHCDVAALSLLPCILVKVSKCDSVYSRWKQQLDAAKCENTSIKCHV